MKSFEHIVNDCDYCPFHDGGWHGVCQHKKGNGLAGNDGKVPKHCPLIKHNTIVRLDSRLKVKGE